jgi:hypothetical protein
MKIIATIYLNSGLIINEESGVNEEYTKDMTEEDIEKELKENVEKIKATFLTPAFKNSSNGSIEFGDTIFKLCDISAVKFVIEK